MHTSMFVIHVSILSQFPALQVDPTNPLARPRVPHELLFVVGGWSGGSPTNIVETYDTRADRWVVCETMDTGEAGGQTTKSFSKD